MKMLNRAAGWGIRALVAGWVAGLAACGGGPVEEPIAASAAASNAQVTVPANSGIDSTFQEAHRAVELAAQAQAFMVNMGQISVAALGSLGIASPYGLSSTPPDAAAQSTPGGVVSTSLGSTLPAHHTVPCNESGFVTVTVEATPMVAPQAGQSVTLQFASCRHRSLLLVDGPLHLLITRFETSPSRPGSWRADIEADFERLTLTPADGQVVVTGRGRGQLSVAGTASANLDIQYTGAMDLQHMTPGGRQETSRIHAAQARSQLTQGSAILQLVSAVDMNLSSPASSSHRWRLSTPEPLVQSAPGALPTAGTVELETGSGRHLRCTTLGADHAVELQVDFSTAPRLQQASTTNWRQLL